MLVAVLAGCGVTPGGRVEAPPSELELTARTLLDAGKHRDAAEQYLRLADAAHPPLSDQYRLDAVSALLDGSEMRAARSLLDETDPGRLSAALRLRRDVQYARIALGQRRPEHALELLPRQTAGGLPAKVVTEMRLTRASAYLQLGQPVAAARERVELELIITDSAAIRDNREHIWRAITQLPRSELVRAQAPPPDTLGGWLELARVAKDHGSEGESFIDALERWRKQFPGHPANQEIVPDLMQIGGVQPIPYRHVALLLPLEGPFAKAAEAVREGFLAAWFDDSQRGGRPVLSVHDTTGTGIRTVYENAVNAGADFIVGPLDKASVGELASTAGLPLPTLALNHAGETGGEQDDGAPQSIPVSSQDTAGAAFYQFALSPEMEAQQVAERAWFDGHSHAAMLTPSGVWGERLARAFRLSWERMGGVVVEHQVYANAVREMPESVKALLNVDESIDRRRTLEGQLGRNVEFQPRRRQDLDFVFMAAFPSEARQLRPQLKFHHAADIPVYATSHVFSGVANSAADRDLDGIQFGDIPWVLARGDDRPVIQRRIQRVWPEALSKYARLFAFGVDAYRIIPHLDRLRLHPFAAFDGQTGRLSVDASNRVSRRLVWARFRAGVPRLKASATYGL